MGRISFRLPDPLQAEVEQLLPTSQYVSVSELIRDLLREWCVNRKMPIKVKPA